MIPIEVAQRIAEYQFDTATQSRISELAVRSNEGTLSSAEHDEYMRYVETIDIVGILKAKARKVLKADGGN
ncbi:MAG: hypothetical protein ACKVP0_12110 [Pirellulaceae bacterium]